MLADKGEGNDVDPTTAYVVHWYGFFVAGHLPRAGGVLANNARLMALFTKFKGAEGEAMRDHQEDTESKAAHAEAKATGKPGVRTYRGKRRK